MLIDREDDDDGEEQGNLSEQSVTDLSNAIKRTVEDRFGLVRVRGEIGRVSRPRSGHVYLSLKDDRSVIDGVLWKGVASRLSVTPEEGMEAVVTGRLTTFGGQSKYQIVIDHLAPAGAGALMAMLDARRRALEAEGLFASARKKAIPLIPKTIGIVTSPSGAVIRDILHRLAERFPCDVLVWPVAVQGKACAGEVARAIRGFDALVPGGKVARPDVLIVARGGGSIEDLWGFNEEEVVRAAAECSIPLISAIGHETDVTLLDHVADLRAPTPTGAAEKAVPVRADLLAQVAEKGGLRLRAMTRRLDALRDRTVQAGRLLPKPDALVGDRRQNVDLAGQALSRALTDIFAHHRAGMADARASLRPAAMQARLRESGTGFRQLSARLSPVRLRRGLSERGEAVRALSATMTRAVRSQVVERDGLFRQVSPRLSPVRLQRDMADRGDAVRALSTAMQRTGRGLLVERESALRGYARMMEAVSYQRVLDRGFAVVRDGSGGVVTSPDGVLAGSALDIEFAAGKRLPVTAGKGAAPRTRKAASRAKPDEDAPDLFNF